MGEGSGEAAEHTKPELTPKFGPWSRAHKAGRGSTRMSKGISGNPSQQQAKNVSADYREGLMRAAEIMVAKITCYVRLHPPT